MTQKKGLLIEIGATIVILMIATIILGVVHNRNIAEGTNLPWTDINIYTVTNNPELQNSVLAFFTADELFNTFPDINDSDTNWNTHIVLAYIGNIAPTDNFSYEITEGRIVGSLATIKYRFSFPEISGTIPLNFETGLQNHPVLFVALDRANIDITNQFTFRFQNADTNETHSLTIFENEIPTIN